MPEPDDRAERAADWVYNGLWRVLSDRFRVPRKPPTLPTPPGEQPDAFKPAAGFLKYRKLLFWIGLTILGVIGLIIWLIVTVAVPVVGLLLALPALVMLAGLGVVWYLSLHLEYDTTWYVISDRSLRIRRGIWIIREMTFTFENVQNVKVVQGPMQRHFGIADLVVETAGSGGTNPQGQTVRALNQGRVEGVADAQALRDRVLSKLRASRSAGFGDDRLEASGSAPSGFTAEHVRELRAIRDALACCRA